MQSREKNERINKERKIRSFIKDLCDAPETITKFDEELWITLVEKVVVTHDRKCSVFFKNGVSIDGLYF